MDNKEKVKEALLKISEKVLPEDRDKAKEKFNVHRETIDRYLRGESGRENFGIELLEFFTKEISDRSKKINKLTAV